jgi:hypothetical protein
MFIEQYIVIKAGCVEEKVEVKHGREAVDIRLHKSLADSGPIIRRDKSICMKAAFE